MIELLRVTQELAQYTNFREKEKEILDRVMDPKRWVGGFVYCAPLPVIPTVTCQSKDKRFTMTKYSTPKDNF